MIGSFWNLCRACPAMPVDKLQLHSEYRSTYRWHEYTGPRQEVIRRPPQTNSGDNNQAYFQSDDVHNELPKLEPAMPRRKKYPDLAYRHHEFLISDGELNGMCSSESRARSEERGPGWRPSRRSKSEGPRHNWDRERERRRESDPDLENMGRESGLLRKAISKISTEYRLQFAWPPGHASRKGGEDAVDSSAPKKSQSMGALKPAANAMVHKKRKDVDNNKDASELEPLVDERNSREEKSHIFKDEFNTEYKKKFRPFSQYEYTEGRFTKRTTEDDGHGRKSTPDCDKSDSWYREVVELRKKAGEYKSYTKEEKEVVNNNKSSPSRAARNTDNSARLMRDMIRHHLERTTGGSEFDGLILSPTREKLEPTIPRKDDDSRGSQKNSPKKSSPMKTSSFKRRNQKAAHGAKNLRSQSVGPITDSAEKRSPQRQSRAATVKERKSSGPSSGSVKRPRPSSLNTTASSRSKHSSLPPKTEDNRLAKVNSKSQNIHDQPKQKQTTNQLEKERSKAETAKVEDSEVKTAAVEDKTDAVEYEPVVKSPPEPTRVKSPEQILMRSPDPVNWTVPLDTGKTFTVTQNVREGDLASRPHSEIKAWTPPDVPPPVAQSAPPALSDQTKDKGMS